VGDRQRRVRESKARQRGGSCAEMEKLAFSFTSIKEYVAPQQIAAQIVLLASPMGRTISGQPIQICGDTQMLNVSPAAPRAIELTSTTISISEAPRHRHTSWPRWGLTLLPAYFSSA
jgi:hypothetical protein